MTEEQNRILEDDQLKKVFEKITKAIDKNTESQCFLLCTSSRNLIFERKDTPFPMPQKIRRS